MAARGTRNLDAGEEKIEDDKMIERLRATSRRINRRALITAAIITLLTLVFP
ncbi:MAG: hypothetical protein M3379_15010 [Acidobacteriota bacterium]|nr:hypothetical protein [Acidobacteriota bacterium]